MVQEILNKTGLNWKVTQRELFAKDYEDNILESPYYGQYRNDTNECLGVSTSRYKVSQNGDVLEILYKYFGDTLDLSKIEGGELKGGRRIYYTIKQDDLFTGTSAHLEQRFIIKDSHDGSSPIVLGFQDKVLLCENGLTRWLDRKDGKIVRIMHTASMSTKLKQFEELYSRYLTFNEDKKIKYENWMNSKITMDLAKTLLERLNNCDLSLSKNDFIKDFSTRKFNIIQSQLECIELEVNRQGMNKFGLINGITNYTTHVLGTKKSSKERYDALMDGSGYSINNRAFEIIDSL